MIRADHSHSNGTSVFSPCRPSMQATPHPVDRSIACTPVSRITDCDPESRSNARAAVSATEESSSTDGTFLRMPDASEENVNVS